MHLTPDFEPPLDCPYCYPSLQALQAVMTVIVVQLFDNTLVNNADFD
jgi:hypothetical protein